MAADHTNIKKGECVGVVYWSNSQQKWIVHDGVLKSPNNIPNGLKPPNSVTIIHYTVHQSGPKKGELNRDECFQISNPLFVLRTTATAHKSIKCPTVSKPKIPKGACVVVKIKNKNLPSGRDSKNGRLLCAIENPNKPDTVFINHFKLKGDFLFFNVKPKLKDVVEVTTGYENATFVKEVKPNNNKKCK